MQKGISGVGGPEARLDDRTPAEFQNLDQPVVHTRFTRPEFSRIMIPSTDMIQSSSEGQPVRAPK